MDLANPNQPSQPKYIYPNFTTLFRHHCFSIDVIWLCNFSVCLRLFVIALNEILSVLKMPFMFLTIWTLICIVWFRNSERCAFLIRQIIQINECFSIFLFSLHWFLWMTVSLEKKFISDRSRIRNHFRLICTNDVRKAWIRFPLSMG